MLGSSVRLIQREIFPSCSCRFKNAGCLFCVVVMFRYRTALLRIVKDKNETIQQILWLGIRTNGSNHKSLSRNRLWRDSILDNDEG